MELNHKLSFWKVNPLVRPALFFISGVKGSEFIKDNLTEFSLAFLLSLILCSYVINKYCRPEQFYYQRLSSFCLFVSIFFAGFFIAKIYSIYDSQPILSGKWQNKELTMKLKISSFPRLSAKAAVKFDAQLVAIKDSTHWFSKSATLKCISFQSEDLHTIKPGDYYVLKSNIKLPQYDSPNSEFDYRNWLINNGYSGTISFNKQRLLIKSDYFHPKRLSGSLQQGILQYIYTSDFTEKNKQLAGALLLGDKLNLDTELKNSFSSSGIIHLLAVSGLHVGLIYQLLTFILALLSISRKNKRISFLIIILVLWTYAFITGLSPSVCRAATMLSITSLAILIKCHKQPFNTLFGTVIILLCVNPKMINDVGFLLSFLAVYGILSTSNFSRQINRIQIKPLRWFLVSILISTSAQLATAPLSLYIFGKFPSYFMIANLFAIPLASMITVTGFMALCFQFIPYLGELCLALCMLFIEVLIQLSSFIASLPKSTLSFENVTALDAFILLSTIIFMLNLHHMSLIVKLRTVLFFTLGFSLLMYYLERKPNIASKNLLLIDKSKNSTFTYFSGIQKIWETQATFQFRSESEQVEPILFVDKSLGFFILKNGMNFLAPPKSCTWMIHIQASDLDYIVQWIEILNPLMISLDEHIPRSEKLRIEQYCHLNGIAIWNWKICNSLLIS